MPGENIDPVNHEGEQRKAFPIHYSPFSQDALSPHSAFLKACRSIGYPLQIPDLEEVLARTKRPFYPGVNVDSELTKEVLKKIYEGIRDDSIYKLFDLIKPVSLSYHGDEILYGLLMDGRHTYEVKVSKLAFEYELPPGNGLELAQKCFPVVYERTREREANLLSRGVTPSAPKPDLLKGMEEMYHTLIERGVKHITPEEEEIETKIVVEKYLKKHPELDPQVYKR